MTTHSVFTIVTDINSSSEEVPESLTRCLKDLQDAVERGESELSELEMLHFASFVIFDTAKLFGTDATEPADPDPTKPADPDPMKPADPEQTEKEKTKKAKLIFECNIDGPRSAFIDRLVELPVILDIYRHCAGYPMPLPGSPPSDVKQERHDYLECKVFEPELYHVGAPYRSKESIQSDRELRRRLGERLDMAMTTTLADHLARNAEGLREYWTWEIWKPWVAWLVGLAGPALVLWTGLRAWRAPRGWAATLVLAVFEALMALATVVIAGWAARLWKTALPELRDRVGQWLVWAAAGVVWAVLAWVVWPHDRRWAVGLAGAFVLLLAYNIYAAVFRQINERLAAIQADRADPPVPSLWNDLVLGKGRGDNGGPGWLGRIWNGWLVLWHLRWWAISWAVVYGLLVLDAIVASRVGRSPAPHLARGFWPVWEAEPPSRGFLAASASLFFLGKAAWLAVLVGWPSEEEPPKQHRASILAFVVLVPAIGFVVVFGLLSAGCGLGLLAAIMLVSLLALWGVPLPSPPVEFKKPSGAELADLEDQEDRDVQNHMSALVQLNSTPFFRAPVLASFLWLLNRLYFRAWLPDFYKGKLFGIPTVHFAQWVLIDDRNYFFFSNYDNSWTSYLDDFGTQLTTGIQKIWGQGRDNPGTMDLVRFKDYARSTMVRHSVWYRAYKGLTVRQIWNNENLRRELDLADFDEEAMLAALRRFGAAPKTLPDLAHATTD